MLCRVFVVIGSVFLLSCSNNSEKSRADKLNKDRFDGHEKKEADFVVELLDTSHELSELAQLAGSRIADSVMKEKIQRMAQGQTSAMMRLRTFAEERGVVVPFQGPEKKKRILTELDRLGDDKFQDAWTKEMTERQQKLQRDIERYRKESDDTTLIHILDSTLTVVKANNEILSGIRSSVEKN